MTTSHAISPHSLPTHSAVARDIRQHMTAWIESCDASQRTAVLLKASALLHRRPFMDELLISILRALLDGQPDCPVSVLRELAFEHTRRREYDLAVRYIVRYCEDHPDLLLGRIPGGHTDSEVYGPGSSSTSNGALGQGSGRRGMATAPAVVLEGDDDVGAGAGAGAAGSARALATAPPAGASARSTARKQASTARSSTARSSTARSRRSRTSGGGGSATESLTSRDKHTTVGRRAQLGRTMGATASRRTMRSAGGKGPDPMAMSARWHRREAAKTVRCTPDSAAHAHTLENCAHD